MVSEDRELEPRPEGSKRFKSIFEPGGQEAFDRQNEKYLVDHLQSLTVEKSIAIMEDLIRAGLRSGFRRQREHDPWPVAIYKRMGQVHERS